MRSLFLLPTVHREIETILELDPKNIRAHALAGTVYMEVPRLVGGDRAKAEEHFKKGLAIDPRFTVLRVDLARLYIATGRFAAARAELTRVLEERAPRIVADWTVKDVPRARALLESIPRMGDSRQRLTAIEGQPPDLAAPPPGCAFHPRCPQAMAQCREEAPPETALAPRHTVRCWLSVPAPVQPAPVR